MTATARALVAATALLAGLAPIAARAETAAVLPVSAAPEIPPDARTRAATAALAALQQDAVHTTGPTDVEHLLLAGDPLGECRAADCAPQVAQRIGVDFVVVLTLWARPHQSVVERVSVMIATQDGRTSGGEGEVTRDGTLETAVRGALGEARQRHAAGNRGALRITSSPPGATVRVDGQYSGETPYFRMVEPGRHDVQLDATGYTSERRSVAVELHRDTEISATLSASHETIRQRRTRTEHPVLGPVLLGVAGLALLAPDVAALTQLGCSGTTCNEIDGVPFALWIAAGSAAIVTAILWALLGTTTTTESVQVGFGPLSVAVTGRL